MSATPRLLIRDGSSLLNPISPSTITYIDGVFEGGGALGAAYIGVLTALRSNNIWFKRVAGNSAGAIVASLIAAGYTEDELAYLSAPAGSRNKPASLPQQRKPIDFMSFIDAPKIETSTRRETILWQALNGTVLDVLGETTLPLPTRRKVVDPLIKTIGSIPGYTLLAQSIQTAIEQAITKSLSILPQKQPQLKQYLPSTKAARAQLADRLWDSFVSKSSDYLKVVNLLYEGGLCEGSVFQQTIESLLREKLQPQHSGPVRFSDLKMDLAIIASDTTSHEMLVYSTKTHGSMSVAEAVRRSMSIPFLFQPRLNTNTRQQPSHEIMDGGLSSNYPYWIFSNAGANFMDFTPADQQRPKLGFLFDHTLDAPRQWGVQPAKWLENGRAIDPGAWRALGETFNLPINQDLPSLRILHRMLNVIETIDNKEKNLRKATAPAIVAGLPYHEVTIPLKGYHWLDFKVNTNKNHFFAMADRGWLAALDLLDTAGLRRLPIPASRPYHLPSQ